jgi:hypothetical protein
MSAIEVIRMPGGIMQTLSKWFPAIGQMPASLQAFCGIAVVTVVVCSVVLFIVSRGRKGRGTEHESR